MSLTSFTRVLGLGGMPSRTATTTRGIFLLAVLVLLCACNVECQGSPASSPVAVPPAKVAAATEPPAKEAAAPSISIALPVAESPVPAALPASPAALPPAPSPKAVPAKAAPQQIEEEAAAAAQVAAQIPLHPQPPSPAVTLPKPAPKPAPQARAAPQQTEEEVAAAAAAVAAQSPSQPQPPSPTVIPPKPTPKPAVDPSLQAQAAPQQTEEGTAAAAAAIAAQSPSQPQPPSPAVTLPEPAPKPAPKPSPQAKTAPQHTEEEVASSSAVVAQSPSQPQPPSPAVPPLKPAPKPAPEPSPQPPVQAASPEPVQLPAALEPAPQLPEPVWVLPNDSVATLPAGTVLPASKSRPPPFSPIPAPPVAKYGRGPEEPEGTTPVIPAAATKAAAKAAKAAKDAKPSPSPRPPSPAKLRPRPSDSVQGVPQYCNTNLCIAFQLPNTPTGAGSLAPVGELVSLMGNMVLWTGGESTMTMLTTMGGRTLATTKPLNGSALPALYSLGQDSAMAAAEGASSSGGGATSGTGYSAGDAILACGKQLAAVPRSLSAGVSRSRRQQPRAVLLVTGEQVGHPAAPKFGALYALAAFAAARAAGMTVATVSVGASPNATLMKAISSNSKGRDPVPLAFHVKDFSQLYRLASPISEALCGVRGGTYPSFLDNDDDNDGSMASTRSKRDKDRSGGGHSNGGDDYKRLRREASEEYGDAVRGVLLEGGPPLVDDFSRLVDRLAEGLAQGRHPDWQDVVYGRTTPDPPGT